MAKMGFLTTNMKMELSFHTKAFVILLLFLFIFNNIAVSQDHISTNNWKWVEISKAEALKLSSDPKNELKLENNKYFVKKTIQNLPKTPTQTNGNNQTLTAPTYWKRNPGLNPFQIKKYQDILFQEESDYRGPSKNNPSVTTEVGVEKYGEWPNAIEKVNKSGKKVWKYPSVSYWFEARYQNNLEKLKNDINTREVTSIGVDVSTLNGNDRPITRGDYGTGIEMLQNFLVNKEYLKVDRYDISIVDLSTYHAAARLWAGNNRVVDFGDEIPTYSQLFAKLKQPKVQSTDVKSNVLSKPEPSKEQPVSTDKKPEDKKVTAPRVKYRWDIPISITPIDRRSCIEALTRYDERGNEKLESGSLYKTTKLENGFTQYEIDKVHVCRCIYVNKGPKSIYNVRQI
jgi:hypothetical protein